MEKDHEVYPARPSPVRLAFRVSYLGSRFFGSQVQADCRTVEGEFIAACQRLDLFSDWRSARFLSAGRTDRGVHACGQVIAFSTGEPQRAVEALNKRLPPDLWCTGYAEVPAEFHPRYDAKSRTYRYYFARPVADPDAMARAARQFVGNHDFSRFARIQEGKNPWRTVLDTSVVEKDGFLCFEVKAESFLWHQVRCMATALLRVGDGTAEADSISRLLEAGSITEKPLAPAPAEGLVLWDTDCVISWKPVPRGDRSREFLEYLSSHHALMAKVCRILSP
jgi:tRNA pseudouridine38-40 synthase